jgi:hypothetical protein
MSSRRGPETILALYEGAKGEVKRLTVLSSIAGRLIMNRSLTLGLEIPRRGRL